MLETLKCWVVWVSLTLLGGFCLAVLSVICWKRLGHCGRILLQLRWASRVVAVSLVVVCIMRGATKETNAPPAGLMGPRMGMVVQGDFGNTDNLPTNGWREVSRSTNALPASIFAMPANGRVWESALACGVLRGFWRVPIDGWSFSNTNLGWTNGFIWAEGQFRPRVESKRDGVQVFDHNLALAPFANWGRYGLDASMCWCATNSVGGLIGTYVGAAVDDDPAKIVNAQFELFPNDGRLALRYDLSQAGEGPFLVGPFENGTSYRTGISSNISEVVFQQVHPDDWDMDGLPNGIDDNPRVASTNAGWNQSAEWAARSFPSNATEIAAAGGYVAWATARGAQPNRHLIGLEISSPSNIWPICLTFGDKQVMCNGKEEILFVIDDGERYSFSLSAGELQFVSLHAANSVTEPCFAYGYPYERWAGDVATHLDSPSSGWICRIPEVLVDTSELTHFYPNDTKHVSAVVTNCHEDAIESFEWIHGGDITFSSPNSLSTSLSWGGGDVWSTNYVAFAATFKGGYAITNSYGMTVGIQAEPSAEFSMTCQNVFFLNDAELDNNGYSPTNRPERIRPITLNLLGAYGLKGNVTFTTEWTPDDPTVNGDGGVLFHVVNGVTNRISGASSIPLEIHAGDISHVDAYTVLMSCPLSGAGRLVATLALTNGCVMTSSAPYRVIEPIRKLVEIEKHDSYPINPSRLVFGTNTVLHVDFHGTHFSPNEIKWRRVSGPVEFVSTNGCYAVVRPTADEGDAVIEARFNDDEIQPTFVLPIVRPRVIPIRAFVVEPPDEDRNDSWQDNEITRSIELANDIFRQVGVVFELRGNIEHGISSDFWSIRKLVQYTNSTGVVFSQLSPEARNLLGNYQSSAGYVTNDCVEIYFTGVIVKDPALAFRTSLGIVVGRNCSELALAHELGHALGLDDCYPWCKRKVIGELTYDASLPRLISPVDGEFFCAGDRDWGKESDRGFYALYDTRMHTMKYFLMYGYNGQSNKDIPDGCVLSLRKYGEYGGETIGAKIGASHFKKTDKEVYTK